MKLQEADEKVAKLFPGKVRSVQYEKMTHSDGEIKVTCGVYVEKKNWHYGTTFQEVIDKLCRVEKEEEPQDIDDKAGQPEN